MCHYLFYVEAEQEKVFGTNFFPYLYIGPIEGTDGKGSVHGKLHVASARCLFTGKRYLFRQVGHGIDNMTNFNVIIGYKEHFDSVLNIGVVVYNLRHRSNQFDHQLGHEVAWGSLAAKDKETRGYVDVRICFDSIV